MANAAAQNDASADYWPIHIARSDGQGYPNLDHSALSLTEDQDITQLERWAVIVAGHLQNQLGPKDDKRQYKLAEFPKGYELRCAVRKDSGRDYYLYGHPAGPKANYRTPGEFALHALWLVSDSTDNSQCPCDLCPKYLERVRPERERSQAPTAAQPPPSAAAAAPRPTTMTQPPAPAQQPTQQPIQQQQQQPPPPGTTGWTNVFRVGELVWYKHTAWRLGVILAIGPKPGTAARPGAPDSNYHFTLAPLGHALLEQASLIKDCQSMRPFLTFSVPNTSMEELKDKTFDTANWQALISQAAQEPDPAKREINRQVLGLEASKMGARAINDAFSTFNMVAQGGTPDGAVRIQHYSGIYLGAEMVRVGDPIRVTNQSAAAAAAQQQQQLATTDPTLPPDTNLVMLITEIQVLTSTTGGARATLNFKGNLYRTIRSPTTAPPPPPPPPPESLSPAFAEELATRNAIEHDKTQRWAWALVAAQVLRAEQDVQGRFYVTDKLMSVIDPGRYQSWVQRGLLEEAPAYLNNRGHSGGGGAYVGRRLGRKAALGAAVGVEFRMPGGLVES
ncbi:transcription-silencing protein Clr2-domain-containing protein [Chaetomidium leptoderma]|uniref:Transcription-silencing protein Clr2-domain-containing protein n=1 Tax=Chaetomidium leptoderma TaxID=669021 RepID=A0AAN7A077_9PEZI|nr:transcription-silencing protein Clr2-domain-containing protein [Chaetomidium leptoderma]